MELDGLAEELNLYLVPKRGTQETLQKTAAVGSFGVQHLDVVLMLSRLLQVKSTLIQLC
jgi:hypothetical protein